MTNDSLPFEKPPAEKKALEESTTLTPRFDANGLLPVVATDAKSGQVLMLGYMNDLALSQTIKTSEAHYWSRSRQELWHKGATSGNVQKVVQILTDCDQDAIVLRVEMTGAEATCHTGRVSCFYREIPLAEDTARLVEIDGERHFDPEEVYGSK